MLEDLMSSGLRDPDTMLERIKAKKSESSLISFIELMWPVLEPGREFKRGKVVEVLCAHLEAVAQGKITRLNINVPPGCMKSLTTSVFFPAWVWGPQKKPWTRFVAFAYSEDLTIRDNKKMRTLIESPIFQKYWGHVVQPDPKEWGAEKISNKQTGYKLATSIGGVGTGERGDIVIIDDPHNVREGESDAKRQAAVMWFGETLPTRVNDQAKSAMVMIMQRVHEADVAGFILENLKEEWEHLCLPMRYEEDHPYLSRTSLNFKDDRQDGELLWPERFPEDSIQALEKTFRAAGGEYAIAGQLQQRPAPREGGMFKRDSFIIIDAKDVPTANCVDVRGWDLAASKEGRAAYTVGLKMRRIEQGDKIGYYILDIRRGQWSPHQVDNEILRAAHDDGHACLIDFPQDPGQAGKSQVTHLSSLLDGYSFAFSPESGSKEDRAKPFSSQVEAGNVYLVRAPWNGSFLAEAENFPNGKYKDQVDAGSRAYAKLIRRRKRLIGAAPETISNDQP